MLDPKQEAYSTQLIRQGGDTLDLTDHLTASNSTLEYFDLQTFPTLLPGTEKIESSLDNEEKFQMDIKKAIQRSLLYMKPADLVRSSDCHKNVPEQIKICLVPSLTTISDDEQDLDVLKQSSSKKVLQWNDGGQQLSDSSYVRNNEAGQRKGKPTQRKRAQVFKFVRPRTVVDLATQVTINDDPLRGMVSIEEKRAMEEVSSSSILALAGKEQSRKAKRTRKQKEGLEVSEKSEKVITRT